MHARCQLLSPFVDGHVYNVLLQTAIDVNKEVLQITNTRKFTPVIPRPIIT